MAKQARLSGATRRNWLIDAAVFIGALLATLTGIYFLFLPIGGYQGGQNPTYGLTIFFARATWDDIHTWGGILMIVAAAVHLTLHWTWVGMMSRKVRNTLTNSGGKFSAGARINVLVDLLVALGFIVTAISGIYFLFLPAGYAGGRTQGWDPGILFSRSTWDLLHTWGAVVMIVGALLHLVIHWRWIVNVSRRIWPSTTSRPSGSLSNS